MGWARFKALVINYWFWIFLGTALVVSLLLVPSAGADSTLLDTGTSNASVYAWAVGAPCEGVLFSPAVSGNASTFVLKDLHIWTYVITPIDLQAVLADSSGTMIASSSIQTFTTNHSDLTFTFSPAVSLISGTNYYIAIMKTSAKPEIYLEFATGNTTIGSSTGALYNVGNAAAGTCNLAGASQDDIGGRSLQGTLTASGPPPPSDAIDITAFLPNTGTGAFWGIDYTVSTSTTYQAYTGPFYEIDLTTGNTSSTYESTLTGRQDQISTIGGSATSTLVPTTQPFTPGITFYAQAQLIFHQNWGDAGLLVATSSVFSFSVSSTTSPGYFPASTSTFPTSTISTANVCDPDAFFLIYGVCRLFVPQASDFVIFNIMKTYVENKPPFGYIGLTVSALSNLNSGTPAFWFPSLTPLALVLDPVRTGINMLLWVLFVFWLLHKFRNVEL